MHASKSPLDSIFDDANFTFGNTSSNLFSGSSTAPATVGAVAPAMALYLTETGTTSAISVADINQGQLGDCFLLSSIGEIVLNKPFDISNMIKANADGTETVTLYEQPSGSGTHYVAPTYFETAFKAVQITVSNVFPNNSVNNGATQDVVKGVKEIWMQVLEKAVATLDGGYNAIANGGNPMIAMEELTGKTATWMSPASVSAATLTSLSNAGNMMVFDTAANNAQYNLVGGHAYMFEGLSTVNGVAVVKLGNPWGFDQPAAIPVSQLSKTFVEIDIGKPA